MTDAPPVQTSSSAIRWLMLAILVWGLLLALGAYIARDQTGTLTSPHRLIRSAIIATCTLAFLGLWAAALMAQGRVNKPKDLER